MKSLQLEGTLRTDTGKTAANQLRKNEEVPCNLYGGADNITFSAPLSAFNHLVYNPDFFTVEVIVDGKSYNTIIKEIQFHPVSDRILHVDFLELVPGKPVIAEIPVALVGLAMGVRNGGKLMQKLRKLKVKATPEALVEKIEINVEKLRLGKSIKVREVSVDGLEILNPGPVPVASVEIPRALRGGAIDEDEEEEGETAEAGAETSGEAAE